MNNVAIKIKFYNKHLGNALALYLTAIKMRDTLGGGSVCNVNIPDLKILIEDINTEGEVGIHFPIGADMKNGGRFPFNGIKKSIELANASHLTIEGYNQNYLNFPSVDEARKYVESEDGSAIIGGSESELVINIRGGEILTGNWPDYTLLPVAFYKFLCQKTGLKPVFCGQLDNNIYMERLREEFPDAKYIPSKGGFYDFHYMKNSAYIVPSISTFSWFAAWLSSAKKIFFPISGMFNPKQHSSSMMIPWDDARYEFYLFPVNYALRVEDSGQYLNSLLGMWRYIDKKNIFTLCQTDNDLDNYLDCFNIDEYIMMYPEKVNLLNQWGPAGLINNYIEDAFWSKKKSFFIDKKLYTRNFPSSALEISYGRYEDCYDHYLKMGRHMEYRKN